MSGIERIEDYEYEDYDNTSQDEEEKECRQKGTHVFGLVDQNPEDESDDENTESI